MKPADILKLCISNGIKLSAKNGQLEVTSKNKKISNEIKELLRGNKGAIISLLGDLTGRKVVAIEKNVTYEGQIPLSHAQKRLWLINQLEKDDSAYVESRALSLKGNLDVRYLERAIDQIIQRHKTLRTVFNEQDGEITQEVLESYHFSIELEDLSSFEPLVIQSEIEQRLNEAAKTPFNLSSDLMLRVKLYKLGADEHILSVNIHHIATDGWSMGILVRELNELYDAFRTGRDHSLAKLPIQYSDYALWQQEHLQEEHLGGQLQYWQTRLAEIPELHNLPLDRARPAKQSFIGAEYRQLVDLTICQGLNKLCESGNTTLFMTLETIFAVLLSRYSGETDVVIGTPVAGRSQKSLEPLIGLFVNTVILRTNVAPDASFRELLRQSTDDTLVAFENQDVPFELLVEKLNPTRTLEHNPLFQIVFSLHNNDKAEFRSSDLTIKDYQRENKLSKFDLYLYAQETDDGLAFTWNYNAELFEQSTIARMAASFAKLIEQISVDPDILLSSLSIETPSHREAIAKFNATGEQFPDDKCIHEFFIEQAALTPEKTAVVFEGQSLSYRQLDQHSNKVANYLLSQGVGKDVLVGIGMERSFELVIGILAILKAGGAYVPLDPEYPESRLEYMLCDSQVKLVLTQSHLKGQFERHGIEAIALDDSNSSIDSFSALTPPAESWNPSNLAYVIYTSGSTGKPKGVLVEHLALVNRIDWMQKAFPVSHQDKILQKTPFSFDVSVWEFLWGLGVGAHLVLSKPQGHKDPVYLAELIKEQAITVLHFVPSMLDAFLSLEELGQSIRYLFCSGEALRVETVRKVRDKFPHIGLHNLYGPTEAAIDVSHFPCEEFERYPNVPIGKPIQNIALLVLDKQLNLCPIGVPGELHIGGVGLARGYLNNSALTASKFISNPFDSSGTSRLYKTGDLVRYLPDMNIEYLGRLDDQVKVRGRRIELGEIEQCLNEIPIVESSKVVVREQALADKVLVAYLQEKNNRSTTEKDRTLHTLPNNRAIACQNSLEVDFLYREIYQNRSYVKHGIQLSDKAVVIDVGANIGLFSLYINDLVPDARIFAYEPAKPVFDTLAINASRQGNNIKVFNQGISDTEKKQAFSFYPNNTVMSGSYADVEQDKEVVKSFMANKSQGEEGFGALSQVDTVVDSQFEHTQLMCEFTTLSQAIAENGLETIDLLKIDVEKAEWDVLMGISDSDWPRIQQVIIEVHNIDNRVNKVDSLLREHGFHVTIEQEDDARNTSLYQIFAQREKVESAQYADFLKRADQVCQRIYKPEVLDQKSIRRYLETVLPDYLLPDAFVVVEQWPLNANGKVDKKALPAPEQACFQDAYVAPKTPEEQQLTEIWADLLDIPAEGISTQNSFFELGGHSLLAVRMIAQVRSKMHTELVLNDIFAAPTITGLAQHISRTTTQQLRPAIQRVLRTGEAFSLSSAQQRLWFLDNMQGGSPQYNIPVALQLEGDFDIGLAERALNQIVLRHESLRTVFEQQDNEPMQRICNEIHFKFNRFDLSKLEAAEQIKLAEQLIEEENNKAFDLSQDLMIRGAYIDLSAPDGTNRGVLLLTLHHIAADGWSMGVLINEFSALYNAGLSGQESPLPVLAVQYADYSIWQNQWQQSEAYSAQLDYWQQHLCDVPLTHSLRLDHTRPAIKSHNAGYLSSHISSLSTLEALQDRAKENQMTLFMLLHAALGLLLARHSDSTDIVIGTPVAGRLQSEVEPLIGFFVNTLVLRTQVEFKTFSDYLSHVKQVNLEAQSNQDIAFEHLVEQCRITRDMSYSPLFQIMFTLERDDLPELHIPGLNTTFVENSHHVAKFDLDITAKISSTGIELTWTYDSALFERSSIEQLDQHMHRLLGEIAHKPDGSWADFQMLSDGEVDYLLHELDNTKAKSDKVGESILVHQLFEAQVEKSPQSQALCFEQQTMSYRELNCRANQLAHYLTEQGVGEETLVGICLDRSVEMHIAILAVLKAGGAYVPIDPDYPQARINYMIEDAHLKFLLTMSHLSKALGTLENIQVTELDSQQYRDSIGNYSQDNLNRHLEKMGNALAYVIYTSGSTGQPKGVAVEHDGLMSRLAYFKTAFPLNESDVVPSIASYAFDISLLELMYPLTCGAAVQQMSQSTLQNVESLARIIEQCSFVHMVPSLARVWLEEIRRTEADSECHRLKYFATGGDKVPPQLLHDLKETFPHVQVVQCYGPTEAVLFSVCNLNAAQSSGSLGMPIEDTSVYVLDQYQCLVPVGSEGELYIGGRGIARGYLNRSELTQQRFIQNPFSSNSNDRLYRTGDKVRFNPSTGLEFVGRIDDQVKVRGFRIELGEIESCLRNHEEVSEVIVTANESPDGNKTLIGFVKPQMNPETVEDDEKRLLKKRLLAHTAASLPHFMQPSNIHFVAQWPLTPNGKIDRKALVVPEKDEPVQSSESPRTDIENRLIEIWAELLEVAPESLQTDDDFFELGGHSLLATKMSTQIKSEMGVTFPVDKIFMLKDIREMAAEIELLQLQMASKKKLDNVDNNNISELEL
ncbi:amino acid adenylation domain-containing protein [Pseudoalteromonas maricaloris]|uniref:amino acid adenylation domain-containing protein n=1 Tax=Pseudoalteromonas maricaloris TaxID=184924 RepID=UPI003C1FB690